MTIWLAFLYIYYTSRWNERVYYLKFITVRQWDSGGDGGSDTDSDSDDVTLDGW